ncbi:pentapeptide repeat-containing protein [Rhizobium ruizarguesonis]
MPNFIARSWSANPMEVVSTGISIVAFIAALSVIGLQLSQNSATQEQLQMQKVQTRDAREQFQATRRTELTRIVFDGSQSAPLRSSAFREILALADGEVEKTAVQEPEAEADWARLATEEMALSLHTKIKEQVTWRCRKFYDTGGGSGTTVRTMIDLRGAKLEGVDLRDLQISCVDLTGGDLRNADLSGATLSNVVLDDIRVQGTNLHQVSISWAFINFADVDGTAAQGRVVLYGVDLHNVAVPCDVREKRNGIIEIADKCR